jgi:hypothetical protein
MATIVLSLLLAAAPSARAAAPVPRAACVQGSVAVFDVSLEAKHRVRAPGSRIRGGRAMGRLPRSYRPGTTRQALRVRFTSKRVTCNFSWAELRVIARGSDARPNPLGVQ